MANYYPPVAFHFKVEVLGLPSNDNDVRFTEVTGLSMEMATEEVPEGERTASCRSSRYGRGIPSWC